MRYLSVCSGIEAASVAWQPLGWEPVAFSEIEAFPSAVLAERFPQTPNWGDMENHKEWPDANVDLLIGGTPCQSFSVAGLRAGLDDPRGNLALTYLAIAERYRPGWLVWENVPGVLSSNGGRDFGAFLGGLAELGYGFAWRVLDAQYVRVDSHPRAVPQRRRRVFLVGRAGGDWRPPAAVLFEHEGLRGDPAPRREARQRVAPTLSARTKGGGGLGTDTECDGGLVAQCVTTGTGSRYDAETETLIPEVAATVTAGAPNGGRGHGARSGHAKDSTLIPFYTTQITSATNRCQPQDGSPCHPLAAWAHAPAVAHTVCLGSNPIWNRETAMPSTARNGEPGVVQQGAAVRRLTPTECERLQGFPDGWTAITCRNKPAADGPRYKALGNSMAVNVVRWVGERIQLYQQIERELSEEVA